MKPLQERIQELESENATLKRGIYEKAYDIGGYGVQCEHKNNLYAHCLACEIDKLRSALTELKDAALDTLATGVPAAHLDGAVSKAMFLLR